MSTQATVFEIPPTLFFSQRFPKPDEDSVILITGDGTHVAKEVSEVCNAVASKGYPVVSIDLLDEVSIWNHNNKDTLAECFGNTIFHTRDGERVYSPQGIESLLFGNSGTEVLRRCFLFESFQKQILERVKAKIEEAQRSGAKCVFVKNEYGDPRFWMHFLNPKLTALVVPFDGPPLDRNLALDANILFYCNERNVGYKKGVEAILERMEVPG